MIEFKDVHKWFGELHVLKGINLKVESAEVLVVSGPSAWAKSTFTPSITRLNASRRASSSSTP